MNVSVGMVSQVLESETRVKVRRIVSTKSEQLFGSQAFNALKRRQNLSEILKHIYLKQSQCNAVYELKTNLRQHIFNLFSKRLKEKIDLYLIGSSLTGLGSNSSDTDLCLVIYNSDNKIDKRYEDKNNVISKLRELSEILKAYGMSANPEVIPALVPILKFIDTSTGIEVNINLNRTVTIRNTHLLHIYSQMDSRVSPLILMIKLWARKNGINSAFNKGLTSYSISLMAIYYLQSVCYPPVVPTLFREFPQLFNEDITRLRLEDHKNINFKSNNTQNLGQLFTEFLEYYCLHFPYDKVISIRTGSLIDRKEVVVQNGNKKVWQWKCHICIEEPFDGTNTSHAVHDCHMFRQIIYTLTETYVKIKSENLNPKNFL